MKNSAFTFLAAISICWSVRGEQKLAPDAILIDSNKVTAAFSKGLPLLETPDFKIHTSRRDAPGVAEIHTRDTDIVHVLEGSATFVTGGVALQPQAIAPN